MRSAALLSARCCRGLLLSQAGAVAFSACPNVRGGVMALLPVVRVRSSPAASAALFIGLAGAMKLPASALRFQRLRNALPRPSLCRSSSSIAWRTYMDTLKSKEP